MNKKSSLAKRATPSAEVPPLPADFGERGIVRRYFQPVSIGVKAPPAVRAAYARIKNLAGPGRGAVKLKNPRAA